EFDGFILKVNSETLEWGATISSTDYGEPPTGMGVQSDGSVWVLGAFSGALRTKTEVIYGKSYLDSYLFRYSPSGEVTWRSQYSASTAVVGQSLVARPDGSVLIGGVFSGYPDFTPTGVYSRGVKEAFIALIP